MIRSIVTPDQQKVSIDLPAAFIGKQVEIIAFTIDEASESPQITESTMTHLASEHALAKDWLTEEEDKAWRDL